MGMQHQQNFSHRTSS